MTEKCPLCNSEVGLLKANFASYVISSKENIERYMTGELTFGVWVTEVKEKLKRCGL